MMQILVVRLSSLGDVIHNLPIIDDILKNQPDAKIDWVCEASFAPIVLQHQGIRRVIPIEWRKWRKNVWQYRVELKNFYQQLTEKNYDLIIDPQGLIKSGLVAFLARWQPKQKWWQFFSKKNRAKIIGYANQTKQSSFERAATFFYTKKHLMPYEVHALDRARLLCAKELQYESLLEQRFSLPTFSFKPYHSNNSNNYNLNNLNNLNTVDIVNTDNMHDYIILCHGSSSTKKFWPNHEWELLIHLLHKKYPNTYLLLPHGNELELQQALKIQQTVVQQAKYFKEHAQNTQVEINLEPYLKVLPRISLLNMYELLFKAKAVIGLDTGLTHLASALGVPTISIYINDIRWRVGAYWQKNTKSLHVDDLQHDLDIHELYEKLFLRSSNLNLNSSSASNSNSNSNSITIKNNKLAKLPKPLPEISENIKSQKPEDKEKDEENKELEQLKSQQKSASQQKKYAIHKKHKKVLPAKIVAHILYDLLTKK